MRSIAGTIHSPRGMKIRLPMWLSTEVLVFVPAVVLATVLKLERACWLSCRSEDAAPLLPIALRRTIP
jgi:hypothetical protein